MRSGSLVSEYTRVAMDKDLAFSKALADAGMDRWRTPKRLWPESVRKAYDEKLTADEHMRQAWKLWRE